jgi:hypothetical protein
VDGFEGALLCDIGGSIRARKPNVPNIQGYWEEILDGSLTTQMNLRCSVQDIGSSTMGPLRANACWSNCLHPPGTTSVLKNCWLGLGRVDRANPKQVSLGRSGHSTDQFGTEPAESRLDSTGSVPNRSTRPSSYLLGWVKPLDPPRWKNIFLLNFGF